MLDRFRQSCAERIQRNATAGERRRFAATSFDFRHHCRRSPEQPRVGQIRKAATSRGARRVVADAAQRVVQYARIAETLATEATRLVQAAPLRCDYEEPATLPNPTRDAVADQPPSFPDRPAGPRLFAPRPTSAAAVDLNSQTGSPRRSEPPVGLPPGLAVFRDPSTRAAAVAARSPLSPAVKPAENALAPPTTTAASPPRVIVRDSSERLAMSAAKRRPISAAVAQPKQHVLTLPVQLLKDLRRLAEIPHSADWSARLESALRTIADTDVALRKQLPQALADLDHYVDEAVVLAADAPSAATRTAILRARYALIRRLAIWTSALELEASLAQRESNAAVERTISLPSSVTGGPDFDAAGKSLR